MSRNLVYTLHLHPPLAHAKHYTGSTRNLPRRLVDHELGRGARLPQVQVERGGTWVLAQTEPGDRDRERQLKQRGAARRCQVCKAAEGYQAGKLTQEQALDLAGWDRASEHDRGLLLTILGIPQAPAGPPVTRPAPTAGGQVRDIPGPRLASASSTRHITPEVVELVGQLEATWTASRTPTAQLAEPEAGS
jgi:predicted GIY-YIG superfamily endonuclease